MSIMVCTLTDNTKRLRIFDLIAKGTQTGATCVPAGGFPGAKPSTNYLYMLADAGNAAAKIYRGDGTVTNDGTRYGHVFAAGKDETIQTGDKPLVGLIDKFVITDTNGAKLVLEWQ